MRQGVLDERLRDSGHETIDGMFRFAIVATPDQFEKDCLEIANGQWEVT